jgi:predicted ATP-grasp superfamily ATP-dependent carboligase
VRRCAIDAVLPISDCAHQALLRHEDLGAPLVAPVPSAYDRLSDKAEITRLAEEVGLGVPRTLEVTSLTAALEAADGIGWPVVLKPRQSVVSGAEQTGQTKLGVVIAADAAALQQAWPQVSAAGIVLVQSFVPGHGEGIFVLRHAGESIATFAHRRLREKPPGGGVSVLRESIAVAPDRLGRVERILDAVGFEGVAMAEFRVQGDDSWLMEFNARLWGSVQLAIDAGVDFPSLLLAAHMGRRQPAPPPFRTGIRLRWLLGDLDHAILLARGASNAEGRGGLAEALRTLLKPSGRACRWEVLRSGDPIPFAHELRRWLSDALAPPRRDRS